MIAIKTIQQYLNKNNTDIAFLIVLLGILASPFIEYSWVVSLIACFFIKEDEKTN